MSDIQVNESQIIKSMNQFAGKQKVLHKKSASTSHNNKLATYHKIQTILTKMDTQMNQLQQLGERTTQDIEKNCAEFVNLDKNLLTDIEVTG
ncbi:DUF5344 family protein [Listeria marthii]|uniref:DUF5344 family protein n=1 Tax=Listeria marthii TaxID=529731 RepID=UPI0016244E5E|nr:DUF5344 family protein [Listeria marthii]MBC2075434.1 DUF5344 family protein [Listeria marthii]MBF2362993.1 DUF5344 family protein [Listeria marthii]